MLYYEEKTTREEMWTIRKVVIYDHGCKVGYVERKTLNPGKEPPRWTPADSFTCGAYEYDDLYTDGCRKREICRCSSVADGKRKFAEWYKDHHTEYERENHADVKSLPASPDAEFYPTPSNLAGQMAALVDWNTVSTVLEPSAGKGDLIECAARCAAASAWRRWHDYQRSEEIKARFDCVEYDENLRHILTGKGYKVIADDFLSLNTQKHYDLIIMNPPFSNGDEHLLKAISMQQHSGGQVVCLLNAETIRNPYTNRRKLLLSILHEHGATIRMIPNAFQHAQRKSDVEVAIVSVKFPSPARQSFILEGLKKAQAKAETHSADPTALVTGDWIDRLVAAYNMEASAGVALMDEYNALAPYIMSGSDTYDKPLIQLSVNGNTFSSCGVETINEYLKKLRNKYWNLMLSRSELTEKMTSQMQSEYRDKIDELTEYDFSRYNVERVIREISAQLSKGVEDSIDALFDTLSAKHSWFPECEKNIHYFNGWATNKAHKVNSKVILPINGFYASYNGKKELRSYEFANKICDIERALSYLDGDGVIARIDPYSVAKASEAFERTTMTFSYFDATFYKKGTCHIKFHPQAQILVDKLNIFAARSRAWLPPCYGKKRYADMDEKEREVIDGFQGEEEYAKVMENPSMYVIEAAQIRPMLTN